MRVAFVTAASALIIASSASAVSLVGVTRIRITSAVSPFIQVTGVAAPDVNGTDYALAANGGGGYAPTAFDASSGPTNAVDGDASTAYISSGSSYDYLDVTFGLPSTLASLTIYGSAANPERDVYDVGIYNVSNTLLYSGTVDARTGFGTVDFVQGGGGTVPELANWALFVTGFGLIGAFLRRRPVAISA